MFKALLLALFFAALLPAQKPNVVVIISDDQAWTDFGFMGHPDIRTPRLDALARQSAVFPRGYVPTSLCRASLATIITGLYPHQHLITGNDPPRGTDRRRMEAHIERVATLPRLLADAGYVSLQTGKWWEGNCECGGFTSGMTHGDPKRGGRHGDRGLEIGRKTMQPIYDFIAKRDGKPFFLWYAPFLPHTPHNPPERLLAKYREEGRSPFVARYYAMCEWFDETCGQLLDHLDDQGLADDTIVLFVTDNGWIQRENAGGYAPRSKRSPYEGGVRTPILVRWPGKVKPGKHDLLASSIDIAPTVLGACGVDVPAGLPGKDLLGLAAGRIEPRAAVFGASFTHDVVELGKPERSLLTRWVVADRWKLVQPADFSRPAELYDLGADPHERNDLAEADPGRVAALRRQMDAWWRVEDQRRPDVLFVLTDDQRADALGCAGAAFLQTPSMDGLARRGLRFENAYVTTAICAASRATILTGLYRSTHGFTFGTDPLARRFTRASYPRLLRNSGYRTGFVGKFGMRAQGRRGAGMFDWFRPMSRNPYFKKQKDGTTRHLTNLIADEAVSFLRGTVRARPLCLSVSFHAPHAEDSDKRQFIWPKGLDALYEKIDFPKPASSEPEFFAAMPEFVRKSMNRIRWKWRFDTEEKRQRMTRGYYRMITGVDRALARILAELERLGRAKNTVVIFTSDNGYFLGERGFAGKWTFHEPSVRVPLIVMDPRLAPARRGTTLEQIALNVDIAPTILDLCGVPVPDSYEGRSLVPLLNGERPKWREDFYYEHRFAHADIPESEGVVSRRWKYVRYFEQEPVYEELYDLAADPREERNLATSNRAALGRLRRRLEELRPRTAKR